MEVITSTWSGGETPAEPSGWGLYRVSDFRQGVSIDRLGWDALELPVGAEVNDNTINLRLGYWDGARIVENPPLSTPKRIEPPGQATSANYIRWILLIGGVALLVVAVVVWQRRQSD